MSLHQACGCGRTGRYCWWCWYAPGRSSDSNDKDPASRCHKRCCNRVGRHSKALSVAATCLLVVVLTAISFPAQHLHKKGDVAVSYRYMEELLADAGDTWRQFEPSIMPNPAYDKDRLYKLRHPEPPWTPDSGVTSWTANTGWSDSQLAEDTPTRAVITTPCGDVDPLRNFIGGLRDRHLSAVSVGFLVVANALKFRTTLFSLNESWSNELKTPEWVRVVVWEHELARVKSKMSFSSTAVSLQPFPKGTAYRFKEPSDDSQKDVIFVRYDDASDNVEFNDLGTGEKVMVPSVKVLPRIMHPSQAVSVSHKPSGVYQLVFKESGLKLVIKRSEDGSSHWAHAERVSYMASDTLFEFFPSEHDGKPTVLIRSVHTGLFLFSALKAPTAFVVTADEACGGCSDMSGCHPQPAGCHWRVWADVRVDPNETDVLDTSFIRLESLGVRGYINMPGDVPHVRTHAPRPAGEESSPEHQQTPNNLVQAIAISEDIATALKGGKYLPPEKATRHGPVTATPLVVKSLAGHAFGLARKYLGAQFKVFSALSEALTTLGHTDWIVFGDDDTFFMPDAVRFVISNVMAGHSVTSKSRVAIGQYSCGLGSFPMQEETGHLCGGAGIIFSRAMAESIVAQKEKCIEAWLNPTLFNLPGWGEQYDMGLTYCINTLMDGKIIDSEFMFSQAADSYFPLKQKAASFYSGGAAKQLLMNDCLAPARHLGWAGIHNDTHENRVNDAVAKAIRASKILD